jgi:hypothetical protein
MSNVRPHEQTNTSRSYPGNAGWRSALDWGVSSYVKARSVGLILVLDLGLPAVYCSLRASWLSVYCEAVALGIRTFLLPIRNHVHTERRGWQPLATRNIAFFSNCTSGSCCCASSGPFRSLGGSIKAVAEPSAGFSVE